MGEVALVCASQLLAMDAAAMQVDAGAEADADDSADIVAGGTRVPRPKRVPSARRHKEPYWERACVRCGYVVATWHQPDDDVETRCERC